MKRSWNRWVAILAVAVAAAGRPAGADAPWLLADAVGDALRANATLQSMDARSRAMRERPDQAQALPNPMLTYGAMGPQNDYRFPNSDEKRIGLEQDFPWFGKRGLRGRIAEQDASVMRHDYEAMRLEVAAMVRERYYELYALEQVIDTLHHEEEVLARMESIARTRYESGTVEQQDVLKAQTEIGMLRQRQIDTDQQRSVLRAQLNQLLNRPADSVVGRPVTAPPDAATPDMQGLIEQAWRNRPELAAARVRVEQAAAERRLMDKEYLPDVTLGVESRSYREGDDELMATIAVDLPVWWGKNRAGVREAGEMAASWRAGEAAAMQQAAFDVQDAWHKLAAARQSLVQYRQALLPQAEQRVAAGEAGYRTGTTDFQELLDSERQLLEFRVMAAMSEGNVGMQWARLERAVGAEPEPDRSPGEDTP